MRRGINIRKRKKILFKELNKKSLKLLALLVSLLLICIVIYIFFVQDIFIKSTFEQDNFNFSSLNENIPFSLRKIILFSSATAESSSANQLLSLDISQYCDIGIYLDGLKDTSATISSLYIDNIHMSTPELGTPYLYKKTVPDIGKCSFDENNIIKDNFNFNIIDSKKSINYNNYEVYNDGTAAIAIGFYNKNIKTEFLTEKSEIVYDGTLLKEAIIPLTSLNCKLSFTINIITNKDEHYICNTNIDIPFEDENNNSIYTVGNITKELNNNQTNKFIRIK